MGKITLNPDMVLERDTGSRAQVTVQSVKDAVGNWDTLEEAFLQAFQTATDMDTPLYNSLIAGEFDDLTWQNFVKMLERIVNEENKAVADMHGAIRSYLIKNEPYGGYATPDEFAA